MDYAIKINPNKIKQAEKFLESKGFTRFTGIGGYGNVFPNAKTVFTYEGHYYYSICDIRQLMSEYDDLTVVVI